MLFPAEVDTSIVELLKQNTETVQKEAFKIAEQYCG